MKFRNLICALLCVVLAIQFCLISISADEPVTDVSVSSGCRGIDSSVPLLGSAQYTDNAQSIILFEPGTDTLMYTWNPDQQLHPAGLVKITTAYVALESANLSDVVTVKEEVIATVPSDARTSELEANDILTVEQLLYCVLVEGSNDAAAVLADHIAGSQAAYVERMNAFAQDLGCNGTVFKNVHGLHDPEQLSTARDIARILDKAIENDTFREMFGTTHYALQQINDPEERTLESSNHMMHQGMYEIYFDGRITGGRTGVNNTGLRCIATTSMKNDLEMICVILGSASVINDRGIVEKIGGFYETSDLLDIAFDGYTTAQVLYAGQTLKQYSVSNGSADVVVSPSVNVSSVVPSGSTSQSFTYRYIDEKDAFQAPIKKGQYMSSVEIWNGSVCIAYADLYAMNDVSVNSQLVIRKEKIGLSGWWVLLIILVSVVVLAAGSIFAMRWMNMRKRKNARTRNMKHAIKKRKGR